MAEKLSQAKNIKLKLYLEGIEIPITQIQIIEEINAGARCSILLPLDEKILDILPRTTVHVFYKDSLIETNNFKDEWILIFEGEVEGFRVSREDSSRSIVINCTNISEHWLLAKKDPANMSMPFKAELTTRVNLEFSQETIDNLVPEDVIESREIVDITDAGLVVEEAPKDTVAQILSIANIGLDLMNFKNAIKNAFDEENQKLSRLIKKFAHSYARTNIGYTLFHATYQMVQRFRGVDNARTDNIMDSIDVQTLLQTDINNSPSSATLQEMIHMALNLFDYKMIYPTAPTFNEELKAPNSFVVLPTPTMFMPPACNIIFKDEILISGYSRQFFAEPTRMIGFIEPSIFQDESIVRTKGNSFVTPTNDITYQPTRKNPETETTNPTDLFITREERLRGVYGEIILDSISELRAKLDSNRIVPANKTESTEKEREEREQELQRVVRELRFNKVDSQFQKARLNASTFNVSTYYSPFRLIGVPGVCMDDALPNVMGIVSRINTVIDANGQASSQISFIYPRLIREEGKNTTGFDEFDIDELLLISGISPDVVNNSVDKAKLWPFTDKEYVSNTADDERWKLWLIEKYNNYEDLVFLNTWYDEEKFFPNKIGKNVYKEMMYGLAPEAESFGEDYEFEQEFFTQFDDGGIGLYGTDESNSDELNFITGMLDNRENTNWIAYYLKTLKDEYNTVKMGDKHRFIHKTTRRRIITESEFWKFLINLKDGEDIKNIDTNKPADATLGLGIRSINTSLSDERKRVMELLEANDGTTASAPFIEERRAVVRQLKAHLERTPVGSKTYLVGVTT